MRSKYDNIVQSLPNDYEKTLQAIQDFLTDDQICNVLTSPDCTIANKTIVNFLMEKVKSVDDIADFCDQLDKITSLLPDTETIMLMMIVNELRRGKDTSKINVYVCMKNFKCTRMYAHFSEP